MYIILTMIDNDQNKTSIDCIMKRIVAIEKDIRSIKHDIEEIYNIKNVDTKHFELIEKALDRSCNEDVLLYGRINKIEEALSVVAFRASTAFYELHPMQAEYEDEIGRALEAKPDDSVPPDGSKT